MILKIALLRSFIITLITEKLPDSLVYSLNVSR